MSTDNQSQVAATRPLGPNEPQPERHLQYNPDPDRDPPKPTEVRDIVRLFQCRLCSFPLREPVSLPCGRSICRQCIPETHVRTNITYPAFPDRLRGFKCPFIECEKEHAVKDCGVDVILNKAVEYIRQEIERAKAETTNSDSSTYIVTQDAWAIAGVASLRDDEESRSHAVKGGKLVATYWLAEEGYLQYGAEVIYRDVSTATDAGVMFDDMGVLKKAQENIRPEMECQVCYTLFYDPLTTTCGHTFCRSCLHRILDHSRYCPICRRALAINPLLNRTSYPSNETLTKIIEAFWLDEVLARRAAVAAETASQLEGFDTALFVCTLSFPVMPTFLHIFEPRYRLMIRRALEGDRTFGMVLPRRAQSREDAPFHELGTMLRIINVQYYPDGRCLIETAGLSRFRVLSHGLLDGYTVGKTERIDDVSLEEEEAMEAAEATPQQDAERADVLVDDDKSEPSERRDDTPISPVDLETMSTQSLMEFAGSFVARMRDQSAPWLAARMLSIYGDCPQDAAMFPWWFASMLPVRELEKYRLLGTSSVRDRLKICCSWIIEWENSRWTNLIDGRSGLSTAATSSD